MSEKMNADDLRRLICKLLERITDVRMLRRIYSFVDKLYCEQ